MSFRPREIDRVLISENEAVPLTRALEMGVTPTYIFCRNDGWTLAAPAHLARRAEGLYPDDWIYAGLIEDIEVDFKLTGAL